MSNNTKLSNLPHLLDSTGNFKVGAGMTVAPDGTLSSTGGGGGVTSIAGATGALTLGTGLNLTGSILSSTTTGGVTNINGVTGAITLGTGLAITGSTLSSTSSSIPPGISIGPLQVFTTAGAYTSSKPTGANQAIITVYGSGGGGGSGGYSYLGGHGGQGGFCQSTLSISASSLSGTIGQGGTGSTNLSAGGNGTAGTSTTCITGLGTMLANGGGGGSYYLTIGSNGSSSGGQTNITGIWNATYTYTPPAITGYDSLGNPIYSSASIAGPSYVPVNNGQSGGLAGTDVGGNPTYQYATNGINGKVTIQWTT